MLITFILKNPKTLENKGNFITDIFMNNYFFFKKEPIFAVLFKN